MSGPNSKGGYKTVKKKSTKINKTASVPKFKYDSLCCSLSRFFLEKKIAKKNCSIQGNGRELFLAFNIIWSVTQSDQRLQQLNSTGFVWKVY